MSDLSTALQSYRSSRTLQNREELILRSMPLVRYVVNQYAARVPPTLERDELIDCGVCGLIEAVERFDPAKNVKFETYAILRIKGAVLDELRSRDWTPRSARRKARQYREVCAKLDRAEDGTIDPDQVAKALGLSRGEMDKRMSEISFIAFVSIDEESVENGEEGSLLARLQDPSSPDPAAPMQLEEKRRALLKAIQDLDEHEKLVITLYYFEGLYLKEIGDILGVTESRVSQIHSRALGHLKELMSEFV